MVDVAPVTCPTDPMTTYLTVATISVLIVQTFIIAFQTKIFSRQTRILGEQTRLSESVELSFKPDKHNPIASSGKQLRLTVTNEGRVALAPEIDWYIMDRKNSAPVASGVSNLQPIGPGKKDEITVLLNPALPSGVMSADMFLKCYWKASGSNRASYSGSQEPGF
jgi:hypothetical protein